MRVNIYTEELTADVKVVTADYVSSRTCLEMTNYGVRVSLKSHPHLHFSPNDDDRSAVTFWLGDKQEAAHQMAAAMMVHLMEAFRVHNRNA